MGSTKMKVLFVCAIGLVLYGGYSVTRAAYLTFSWNETEGEVVDFERDTFSCGKGVNQCYALVVSYMAGDHAYRTTSVRKFDYMAPVELLNSGVTVYYSPANPADAILGGAYGPMRYGIWLFLFGVVMLVILWVVKKKSKA